MSFPSISLKFIQNNATAQSFERGDRYYRSGSVEQITQRGNVLRALVKGSEPGAYQVTIPSDGVVSLRRVVAVPIHLRAGVNMWLRHF